MRIRILRLRWWLWNKCYDWDAGKTFTFRFPPSWVGDILVWAADTFCNLTDEELNLLDVDDLPGEEISDEMFEKYFEELRAGSLNSYDRDDDGKEFMLFDIDTDEYWGE